MLTKRLIACFDVVERARHEGPAVPGQHRRRARPRSSRSSLYDDQIDEIVFYDIMASAEQRKIDLDTVRARRASTCSCRSRSAAASASVDDMFEVLKAGAEKISVDSMAVRDPDIIRQGAEAFGRQCIVLSTQVKHVGIRDRASRAATRCSSTARARPPGMDAVEWVRRGEELGAGEIVVNSIDRDGTASGYDLDITRAVADAVNVPVIASGGAGTVEHIADGLTGGGAVRPRSSARSSTHRASTGTSACASSRTASPSAACPMRPYLIEQRRPSRRAAFRLPRRAAARRPSSRSRS